MTATTAPDSTSLVVNVEMPAPRSMSPSRKMGHCASVAAFHVQLCMYVELMPPVLLNRFPNLGKMTLLLTKTVKFSAPTSWLLRPRFYESVYTIENRLFMNNWIF